MNRTIIFFFTFLLFLGDFILAAEPAKWVFTHYPPANYISESGEFEGFLYDIIVEAFEERMNIPFEVSVYPWTRCQLLVKNGTADMFVTIPTDERSIYASATTLPIWIKKRSVFTYPDHPRIEEINRIDGLDYIRERGFSVISYYGNNWVETVVEGAGIPVYYANSVEGMYKMLSCKRGDLIIEQECLVQPKLSELNLTDKVVATEGLGAESRFHILIGNGSYYHAVLPRLNGVVEQMLNDGTIERILAEYGM